MKVATPKHFCKYCGKDATVIVNRVGAEPFYSCNRCYKIRKAQAEELNLNHPWNDPEGFPGSDF